MQGTALFVYVARAFALANGIGTTGTRERLTAIGGALNVPIAESESWTGAFDFLQMLRLRVQRNADAAPNHVELATLSDIDRRVLRESFRVVRRLQQRLELDYMR
jgi:CBS domain-containing protein